MSSNQKAAPEDVLYLNIYNLKKIQDFPGISFRTMGMTSDLLRLLAMEKNIKIRYTNGRHNWFPSACSNKIMHWTYEVWIIRRKKTLSRGKMEIWVASCCSKMVRLVDVKLLGWLSNLCFQRTCHISIARYHLRPFPATMTRTSPPNLVVKEV